VAGIEFQDIAFKNAFTYERAKVPLADQGLVLVHGANGAAKSALFDVVRHVLLGSTARGTKGRDIVRAGQSDGYVALLKFRRAGHDYTVRQTVGHARDGNQVAVYRDGTIVSHQRAKVRTQRVVADELLGMTAQQFDAAILISQEAAHPLVNGTGAECAKYLAQTFGLECYDEYREKLRDAIKHHEVELAGLQHHEQEVKRLEARLVDLGEDPDLAAQQARDQADRADRVERSCRAKLDQAEREVHQADRRVKLVDRAGGLDAGQVAAEIKAIDTKLARVDQVARDLDARRARQARRASLLGQLADLPDTADSPDTGPWTQELGALRSRRDRLVGLASQADRMDRLDGQAECPTCGQPVDPGHVAQELDRARRARLALARIDQAVRGLESKIGQAGRLAARQAHDQARRKILADELAGLPDDQIDHDQVDQVVTRRQALRDRRDDLVASLDAARELADLPAVDPDVARATRDALAIRLEKARMNARESAVVAGEQAARAREAGQVRRDLEAARVQVVRWAAGRRDQDRRKALYRALAKLKVRRLHDVVAAIQRVLPDYVATMWGGAPVSIEVDDQDPESIDRYCSRPGPDGPVRIPVRALSKGERARLRVACVLAVRALVSPERQANVLVLDEADGGLDLAGLEAYGQLLEGLRQQYSSVFVVSHRKELSTVQFDRVWRVVKDEAGQSHVETS
jgi:DNA repair exonuclease SbcCD ATPase subunit